MTFSDLPHLHQLQRDLWAWPNSRSALMVGAGFSLNAEPLAGVTSRFPTWRELVRAMFDELHPPSPGETKAETDAREMRFNRANPLRIASGYEAALGPDKLQRIIKERTPDLDFRPGHLHQLLLELPWADVFTTNYDTLLERTEISWRNYQPVLKADELPTSFAPRIVKLHGSFPSQTPFIISEEDYRRYPRDFAPFVNTVQQALLENSFVLVGFSGDDPNFLAWTGWIRDELGENHAPIYLVGPLSLANADRQLLARRGVTPIDLAPLFPRTPRNEIHRISIEWFLKCLAGAKPPRPDQWPDFPPNIVGVPDGFPPIVGATESIPEDVQRFPSPGEKLSLEMVLKLFKRWQFERTRYPGWVVLPHGKRESLWDATKHWLGPLFEFSKNWSAAERLLLFREINWRLETAMVPLLPYSIKPFEKATSEVFPVLASGETLNISLSIFQQIGGSGSDVVEAWSEIIFALLREARETFNEVQWSGFKAQIDKIVARYPAFADQNHYEGSLWAIWNVKRAVAHSSITRWQPSPNSPLASMRKAGLLAELDEFGEARNILRAALSNVRKALRAHGRNIQLLSLEGWITFLIFAVEQAKDFGKWTPLREEFLERWQELKAWDCSPWDEKHFFEEKLADEPPFHEVEEQHISFDGRVSVSHHFSGDLDSLLPAFACIRLYEQVGIPMRLPHMNILGDALAQACNWIAPFIGFWSPVLLTRAGNLDCLKKSARFLARSGIAALTPEVALRLHAWSLGVFESEVSVIGSSIPFRSAQESILRILPEVISRLACRMPETELRRSFQVALKFHKSPAVRSTPHFHDICRPWFERLYEAADGSLLLEWLPDLLTVPLFDEVHRPGWEPEDFSWPDPMENFPVSRAAQAKGPDTDLNGISGAVDWLLSRASSEKGVAWRRAMIRLLDVFSAKLLSIRQEKKFAEQLWSKRGKNELPELTTLKAFGYVLHFPSPDGIDIRSLVKKYILSLEAPSAALPRADGQPGVQFQAHWKQPLIHEAIAASKPIISFNGERQIGIDWSPEEAVSLYEKVRLWWQEDQKFVQTKVQRERLFFDHPILMEAGKVDDFLFRVVLPSIRASDDLVWQSIFKWLDELRSVGVYPTLVLPYILLHHPTKAPDFSKAIADDLNSDLGDAVIAAAWTMLHWAHLITLRGIPPFHPEVIECLLKRVLFRRKIEIHSCVAALSNLVYEKPNLFTREQIEMLISSLLVWKSATLLPVSGNSASDFPEVIRPTLRSVLGELAGAIKSWHLKSGFQVPIDGPLVEWEVMCTNDPLPEMRRAFNKWGKIEGI